jgi:ABC-2 type transport system permease protein
VNSLRYWLSLYRTNLKVSIMDQIQYRASGMIWMISSVLEPTIYLLVWSTVAEANGGAVGGFTASEFAAYYIVLMLINHLTFSWVMQVFQYRIQYGELSYDLLRPIHPIHKDVTDNIAYKIVQMTVMTPALIVLILLFEPSFNFELVNIAIAIPVLMLAFAVRFLLEWSLALVAFWTTRITAINNAYFVVAMFLSGRIAPIALFPIWLQDIAETLPFYYVIAFPAEVILGRIDSTALLSGLGHLMVWLALALALLGFAWRRGVKAFGAVGG